MIPRENEAINDDLDWDNAENSDLIKLIHKKSPRLKEKLSNVIVKRRIFIDS